MTEDEIKRLLEGLRPPEEIAPFSSLETLVGAPLIVLDESPICQGYSGSAVFGSAPPDIVARDGVKFYPVANSYEVDASALAEASAAGKSVLDRYTEMIEEMRAREEQEMRDRMGRESMAFIESLGDAPERIDPRRVFETKNDEGEKVLYVLREPDDLTLKIPMTFEHPDPPRFMLGQQLGGYVQARPLDRIITVTSIPMPKAPGVQAMLKDGWVWTGWRFARDPNPSEEWTGVVVVGVEDWSSTGDSVFVRTGPEGHPGIGQYRRDDADGDAVLVPGLRWIEFWKAGAGARHHGLEPDDWLAKVGALTTVRPGRYAGFLSDRRVVAGRYAERLPTNRGRKRARAKARRRDRKRGAL